MKSNSITWHPNTNKTLPFQITLTPIETMTPQAIDSDRSRSICGEAGEGISNISMGRGLERHDLSCGHVLGKVL